MANVSVNTIAAFDSSVEKKVAFRYEGNQCIANTITVYNSSTNASVYSHKVTSFALSHTIPANTLTNGVSYYVKITAHYMDGATESSVTSAASNVFACLAMPTWGFTGIANDSIVNNATLPLTMTYIQAQSEEMNEFYIEVYSSSHNLFHQSPAIYDITSTYTVAGLEDDEVYYLRAHGTTVNGLVVDTRDLNPNDIKITVSFTLPDVYSLAYLENLPDRGVIRVSLNVASIEGRSGDGGDLTFEGGEYVDLTNKSLIYDENILVSGDFSFLVECKNIVVGKELFRLDSYDKKNSVVVVVRKASIGGADKYYAELRCTNINLPLVYAVYTDFKSIDISGDVCIYIGRKNGLFELKMEVGS